jgi:hypothetical protein
VFDLHVHSAPCLLPRWGDDIETVKAYESAGFAGCVLKGHFESTVGRARAAGVGRRLTVVGGVVLNGSVGGLDPRAADDALALGARVVWMPTFDARSHRRASLPQPRTRDRNGGRADLAVPPEDPTSEPAVRRILSLIAEADAVIATGHLSAPEAGWLVRAAREAGVRRVLLTHPSFPVPSMSVLAVRELQDLGAFAEVTAYQLLHQKGADAASLTAFLRELDPERCILSSDAGQPESPPPPDALAGLVDAVAHEGFDRGAVAAMASEIPARLVLL